MKSIKDLLTGGSRRRGGSDRERKQKEDRLLSLLAQEGYQLARATGQTEGIEWEEVPTEMRAAWAETLGVTAVEIEKMFRNLGKGQRGEDIH